MRPPLRLPGRRLRQHFDVCTALGSRPPDIKTLLLNSPQQPQPVDSQEPGAATDRHWGGYTLWSGMGRA